MRSELEFRTDLLTMPLPEDILRKKMAGDLEGAARAIRARLAGDLPRLHRDRLELELERLRRLPSHYPWTKAEILQKTRELIPAMTEEWFDSLEDQGRIDFIYLNGEKRYFIRAHRTLARFKAITGKPESSVSAWLDPMIAVIKEKGILRRRITLETSLKLEEDRFVPGDYVCHMPFPIPCAQQSRIALLAGDPDLITPEDAGARTAVWRGHLENPREFKLRYCYDAEIRYADPLHRPAPEQPLYPREKPVCPEDLQEEGNWIRFTPWLRELCSEITEGVSTPVEKAKRIYDFVTTKVNYAFQRDYFNLDDPACHCALNFTGDCGLQALLFITLCRISGIPARWQSGLDVEADTAGDHDWAQFWLDGWGWLFADPSFGGGGFRCGNEERRAFYFGNIDPMRMAANRQFAAPFAIPLGAVRIDPMDNQEGEIARVGADTPFSGDDLDTGAVTISIEDPD